MALPANAGEIGARGGRHGRAARAGGAMRGGQVAPALGGSAAPNLGGSGEVALPAAPPRLQSCMGAVALSGLGEE
eukprot:2404696-Alexandrium_andersonii.AAC.1